MKILRIWDQIGDLLGQTPFHPQYFIYTAEASNLKITLKNMKGNVLDVGSGRQKLKKIIEENNLKYISLDHPSVYRRQRSENRPDILADITSIPLKNSSIDNVLLFMVLEHLPHPEEGLMEIYRILKKEGKVFVSTIENYPTHDAPNDYFRYKLTGVASLCKKAGFKIIKTKSGGNIWQVNAINFNTFILQTIKYIWDNNNSKFLLIILLIFLYPLTIISNLLAILLKPLDLIKTSQLVIYTIAQK